MVLVVPDHFDIVLSDRLPLFSLLLGLADLFDDPGYHMVAKDLFIIDEGDPIVLPFVDDDIEFGGHTHLDAGSPALPIDGEAGVRCAWGRLPEFGAFALCHGQGGHGDGCCAKYRS